MILITVGIIGKNLIETKCEICGWSTDSSVGNAIKEAISHILAEHSRELTPEQIYHLLKNL